VLDVDSGLGSVPIGAPPVVPRRSTGAAADVENVITTAM